MSDGTEPSAPAPSHLGSLHPYGWNDTLGDRVEPWLTPGLVPARITARHPGRYDAVTSQGPTPARLAGAMAHRCADEEDFPAVGDWVVVELPQGADTAVIQALVPRRGVVARGAVGGVAAIQILAANVDLAYLVTTAGEDFNLRRLERYAAVALDGGVRPLILVNKVDLVDDASPFLAAASSVVAAEDVRPVSALTLEGLAGAFADLGPGVSAVVLGSSGVGKSALTNALLGRHEMATGAVRAFDAKGRHTTSCGALHPLPGGGVVIDTPGLRELAMAGTIDGVAEAFDDVEEAASGCRYRDCRHEGEPGCALAAAMEDGRVSEERVAAFLALRDEAERTARRLDARVQRGDRGQWKKMIARYRAQLRDSPKRQR